MEGGVRGAPGPSALGPVEPASSPQTGNATSLSTIIPQCFSFIHSCFVVSKIFW